MKDKDNNSQNPTKQHLDKLGVWNDPDLEARVVAMLMEELSPYEQAEMEEELERSPELRLFRDRIIKVQGLIADINVENQENSDDEDDVSEDWTLSPERRRDLLETFSEKPIQQPDVVTISTGGIQWRNIIGVAACFVISFVAFIMMVASRMLSMIEIKSERVVQHTYSLNGSEADEFDSSSRLLHAQTPTSLVIPEIKPNKGVVSGKKKGGKVDSDKEGLLIASEIANTPIPVSPALAYSAAYGSSSDFGDRWRNQRYELDPTSYAAHLRSADPVGESNLGNSKTSVYLHLDDQSVTGAAQSSKEREFEDTKKKLSEPLLLDSQVQDGLMKVRPGFRDDPIRSSSILYYKNNENLKKLGYRACMLAEADTFGMMSANKKSEPVKILVDKTKPAIFGLNEDSLLKPGDREKNTFKEISAAEQSYSTFSLNVSDVSYKLAKSVLLEKGGVPVADKIRVEEFVNAFDYGDPNASGRKVNCVVEQCAHPYYQQRNLMRIGLKTGVSGRSKPLRLTVLLDNSGSMERADRAATVLKALDTLAKELGPEDEVTLLSFARGARMVAQKVKGNKAHTLVDLVKAIPSEGGTNLSLAIEQAYAIAQQNCQKGTMSRIVLITDGAANLGNVDPEDLSKSIDKMRQKGISFDACGVVADGLDDNMLEALTRKGDGRYYFINRPEDADAGFAKKLAGALRPAAKNVKIQVVFNPKRVGNYRLLGFQKHRLKKQDFRNDAVDAAEMAAEEAGNALYQVEAKPNGAGDVGSIFVRFHDVSSGKMIERSWTIPYEPVAKNIHSAAPSMQLATVAGMLGEHLKLGEEAGIDLKRLRAVFGNLRNHYHTNKDVKDLLRMSEKIIGN